MQKRLIAADQSVYTCGLLGTVGKVGPWSWCVSPGGHKLVYAPPPKCPPCHPHTLPLPSRSCFPPFLHQLRAARLALGPSTLAQQSRPWMFSHSGVGMGSRDEGRSLGFRTVFSSGTFSFAPRGPEGAGGGFCTIWDPQLPPSV